MKTFSKLVAASALAILPLSAFAQTSGTPAASQTTAPAASTDTTAPAAVTGDAAASTKDAGPAAGAKADTTAGAAKTDASATASKTEAPAKVGTAGTSKTAHVTTARKPHVKTLKVNPKVTAPTGVEKKAPDALKS